MLAELAVKPGQGLSSADPTRPARYVSLWRMVLLGCSIIQLSAGVQRLMDDLLMSHAPR